MKTNPQIKKFLLLKENIKKEHQLHYPWLKQVSDQLLSDYIDVSWSQISNYRRYKKETQIDIYNKLKEVDLDELAFWILKRYSKKNI